MKKIELEGLDKVLYQETLSNGLEVCMIPYEDKKNYYISYVTRYGSDILTFIKDEEEYTPPLGVAHYLEHKMFEEASGIDPFTFFSESGTDSNASTSYDHTEYICYGSKDFLKNLRYLIHFVNDPFFTNENVKKEKGIISEEISMYNDMPDYKLEMKLRDNVYHNSPRKYDIAGSIKDIKKITKEDLYDCYNAFYKPNNMFIVITGNFNPEEAIKIIKEELDDKEKTPTPRIITKKEPKEVVKKVEKIYENIEVPKIGFALKIPREKSKVTGVEKDLYLHMLSTVIFGASSLFRERMRNQNLFNDIFLEWEDDKTTDTFYLMATSLEPEKLLKEIKYELNNISISRKDFERIKKVWIANENKMIDHIEKTENNIIDDMLKYHEIIPNRISKIRKLSLKVLNDMIKSIDFDNTSTVIMLNKEK